MGRGPRRNLGYLTPPGEDEWFALRVAAVLFMLGAALGALSLLLPNEIHREELIWVVVVTAGAWGLAINLSRERLPRWALHGIVAVGSVMINVTIAASAIEAGLYGLMFFWIVIFCAYFFSPHAVAAHLAWLVAWFGAALAVVESSAAFSAVTRWVVTTLALAVAAVLASWLVARREQAERRSTRFFDLSLDMLCTLDGEGRFVAVNDAWTKILGRSRNQISGRPLVSLLHGDDRVAVAAVLTGLREGKQAADFECRLRSDAGTWRWLLWKCTYAEDEDLIYGRASDVTEQKQLMLRVEEEARTDVLTGLPNRRCLDDELELELARADRQRFPICAAMIDLDYFKAFNDRFGHAGGDALLVEATEAWRRSLRTTDFLARYGGEEFVVLLPDCEIEDAFVVMDRVRMATPRGESCSIGIARWTPGDHGRTLIREADEAMYEAKQAGRDRVCSRGIGRTADLAAP